MFRPLLLIIAFLGSSLALTGCGSSEDRSQLANEPAPSDLPTAEPTSTAIPMTVSLGQALRCSRIGEFAASRDTDMGSVSSAQARIIALKAKNAAYAEGAKQDLTPSEIEDQEHAIYLGYESAGLGAVSGFRRSKEEEEAAFAEADRRTKEAIARVEPELTVELNEICAPMFLD